MMMMRTSGSRSCHTRAFRNSTGGSSACHTLPQVINEFHDAQPLLRRPVITRRDAQPLLVSAYTDISVTHCRYIRSEMECSVQPQLPTVRTSSAQAREL